MDEGNQGLAKAKLFKELFEEESSDEANISENDSLEEEQKVVSSEEKRKKDLERELFGEEKSSDEEMTMKKLSDTLNYVENRAEELMAVDSDAEIDLTDSELEKGEDEEEYVEESNILHVELPSLPSMDEGPANKIVLIKWPAYMKVSPEPYDPSAFKIEEAINFEGEDEEVASARVACVCRWRKNTEGLVESNAHIIQWSNDSYSLSIGNEIFDLGFHTMEDENVFLYAIHEGSILEDLCRIKERVLIKPPSDIGSSTGLSGSGVKKWARVAKSMAESKVKMAVTTKDPEVQKAQMEKAQLEKYKIARKMEAKKRAVEQSKFSKYYHSQGLTKELLEADENDEDLSKPLVASKHKSRYDRGISSEDDEEDDEEEDEEDDIEEDDELDQKETEEEESEAEETESESASENDLDDGKSPLLVQSEKSLTKDNPVSKRRVLSAIVDSDDEERN